MEKYEVLYNIHSIINNIFNNKYRHWLCFCLVLLVLKER